MQYKNVHSMCIRSILATGEFSRRGRQMLWLSKRLIFGVEYHIRVFRRGLIVPGTRQRAQDLLFTHIGAYGAVLSSANALWVPLSVASGFSACLELMLGLEREG